MITIKKTLWYIYPMRPTIHQLKIFRSVAEHKNFTKVAQILHMSQPAVSMQVKQIESTVGLPLLEQIGKKLYLTEAGKAVNQCAINIARQLETTEEIIDQFKGIHKGKLRISVATTAGYFVIKMLSSFSSLYPEISIQLDVTNRQSILEQLENNERDLVIMGEPPENKGLESQAFMDNPLIIVASPEHPINKVNKPTVKHLEKIPFVTREKGSGTRAAIERFFEPINIDINYSMEMTSNEAIKQAVQAGMGLGIVSSHTVQLELETGYLKKIQLKKFPIMRKWYLVQRINKLHSPVANLFESFVLEYTHDLTLK